MRKIRKLRDRIGWTDEHIETLLHGFDWFCAFEGFEPRKIPTRCRHYWDDKPHVEARLREAVDDLGDELLAKYIEVNPFKRPWFWWRLLAPERRRCISGKHRYDRPEYANEPHKLFGGLPAVGVAPDFGIGEEYETERDYLIRLNLLTDYERELIARASR